MLAAGIYQLETIQDVLPARVESYQCSDDKIMKTKKGLMQRPTVMCYWNYLWPKTNAPQEFLFLPLDETKKKLKTNICLQTGLTLFETH